MNTPLPTPTEEQQEERGRAVYLTEDEIDFVVNELRAHGHGKDGGDFEPECPTCTATEKLRAALTAGVPGTTPAEPAWWAGALNRRATVEQWMFDAARGKRPMPTPDELRAWAIKLGTPESGEPAGVVVDAAQQTLTVAELAQRSGVKALTVMQRIKEWGGGDVTLNQPINLIGLATAALSHGVMASHPPIKDGWAEGTEVQCGFCQKIKTMGDGCDRENCPCTKEKCGHG